MVMPLMACPEKIDTCYDCPQTECPAWKIAWSKCCICNDLPSEIMLNTWNELRPVCKKHADKIRNGQGSYKTNLDIPYKSKRRISPPNKLKATPPKRAGTKRMRRKK